MYLTMCIVVLTLIITLWILSEDISLRLLTIKITLILVGWGFLYVAFPAVMNLSDVNAKVLNNTLESQYERSGINFGNDN